MEHSQQKEIQKKIQEGLERLAFGSVGDAVKLLFARRLALVCSTGWICSPWRKLNAPKEAG